MRQAHKGTSFVPGRNQSTSPSIQAQPLTDLLAVEARCCGFEFFFWQVHVKLDGGKPAFNKISQKQPCKTMSSRIEYSLTEKLSLHRRYKANFSACLLARYVGRTRKEMSTESTPTLTGARPKTRPSRPHVPPGQQLMTTPRSKLTILLPLASTVFSRYAIRSHRLGLAFLGFSVQGWWSTFTVLNMTLTLDGTQSRIV